MCSFCVLRISVANVHTVVFLTLYYYCESNWICILWWDNFQPLGCGWLMSKLYFSGAELALKSYTYEPGWQLWSLVKSNIICPTTDTMTIAMRGSQTTTDSPPDGTQPPTSPQQLNPQQQPPQAGQPQTTQPTPQANQPQSPTVRF
jgi:hypothetical protein